jgi:porphobilinogen synthase
MNPTQSRAALKLTRRLRRLRTSPAMRALVRETRLSPDMFVLPLFVCEGEGVRREVPSMPGVFNLSVDEAVRETTAAKADGINAVLLFGLPDHKDDVGSASADPDAPVQTAVRAIKRNVPDVLVITDVCLCEYTDHGHCGIVIDNEIVNDPTVDLLVKAALSHAAAGADIVAPSDMMDGRVGAIREALDARGSTARRSTGRSAMPRGRRPGSATADRIRWIRPTPRRRCARSNRTSKRARTS